MIRVLYITREPFPSFRVDIKTLFGKYLPRYGVYTSILSYQDPNAIDGSSWRGLEPIIYRRIGKRILAPLYGILETLLVFINGRKYDIIQVRDKPFVGLYVLVISKLLGREFVFWMSFPFPEADLLKASIKKINPFKRGLLFLRGFTSSFVQYRLLMRFANHIVVQSDAMRRWLSKHKGIKEDKMFPVPMGIDLEEIKDLPKNTREYMRRILGVEDKIVLCYTGQISEVRGMDMMFSILKRLVRERDDIHILLIGDAPGIEEKKYLKRVVNLQEFKGRITCTGWIPQNKVKEYLSICDIGLSILDNSVINSVSSPTKLMEYAALGVPSLVSGVPDQHYVVEKTGCGISTPYDEEELYKSLRFLIENEGLRKEYGKRGRLNIGKLRGYDKIAKRVEEYYRSILSK